MNNIYENIFIENLEVHIINSINFVNTFFNDNNLEIDKQINKINGEKYVNTHLFELYIKYIYKNNVYKHLYSRFEINKENDTFNLYSLLDNFIMSNTESPQIILNVLESTFYISGKEIEEVIPKEYLILYKFLEKKHIYGK